MMGFYSLTCFLNDEISAALGRKNMLNIVLSDGNKEFCGGLKTILERAGFKIIGETEDGVEALLMVEQKKPDFVILEMNTLRLNGFEVSREIARRSLETKVIMLSMFEDGTNVLESFRAGVKAYILKTHVAQDIVQAIHQLSRGKHFLSPAITSQVVEPYQHHEKINSSSLTGIESDILQMLAQDKPKNDIARQLNITNECLESHRKKVMEKLRASNIGGLTRHAVRKGMLRV